jgi:hypothetical protein
MITMTTKDTAWIASSIASVIATNESWNAFSVSVSVSRERVLEHRVDRRRNRRRLGRIAQSDDEDTGLVAAPWIELLDRLVEQRPVEEHRRLVGALLGALVDAAQVERPGSRIDRAAERDLVAHLPAVLVGELAADDRALAVDEKRLALLRGNRYSGYMSR